MLTICSVVAYRTMRDAWFIAIPGCIADLPACEVGCRTHSRCWNEWEERTGRKTGRRSSGVAAAVAMLLFVVARGTDFTQRGIDRAISSEYPVNAVNFLRQHPQPGPLYNNLGWGGFLMWYMPDYPVAVDGRNDLYGDQLDQLFYASQNGTRIHD